MSDAKKCDRCGKFYERNELPFDKDPNVCYGSDPVITGVRLNTQLHGVNKPFDLCDECSEQLIDWLECQKKGEHYE